VPAGARDAAEAFCRAGDYGFDTDFETGALYTCSGSGSSPVLTIAPEYAPINPSPWYAWRVTPGDGADDGPVEVTVRQYYRYARHRYHPWVSVDGERWQRLAASRVRALDDGSAEFRLNVPADGLYVAAQPPLGSAAMGRWARDLSVTHGLRTVEIARSAGGRPVMAYETGTPGRRGALVLTGRQHPPEVTGGLAFQDFVERLLAADPLAERFRATYAIGLVPEVNPDGVARGHWRTNLRGVDLNRDWGPFTQPETRGVADWLAALDGEVPLRLFVDFHSTWQDVFYMPHPEDDPEPAGFAAEWRRRLAARLGEAMPDWSGQHNPGLPTAKSWVRKAYGVVAMTYEVGDETPRERIRTTAAAAAEEMMKLLQEIEESAP
jgi:predicted deacylase